MTTLEHSSCRLVDYFTTVLKAHDIVRIGRTDYKLQFDCRADADVFARRHDLKTIAVNPYGYVIALTA